MAQTFTEDINSLSPQQIQKQRRKQIKRQTKMMLRGEQTKRDVQKAERKMAKARLDYDIATTGLRTYEHAVSLFALDRWPLSLSAGISYAHGSFNMLQPAEVRLTKTRRRSHLSTFRLTSSFCSSRLACFVAAAELTPRKEASSPIVTCLRCDKSLRISRWCRVTRLFSTCKSYFPF